MGIRHGQSVYGELAAGIAPYRITRNNQCQPSAPALSATCSELLIRPRVALVWLVCVASLFAPVAFAGNESHAEQQRAAILATDALRDSGDLQGAENSLEAMLYAPMASPVLRDGQLFRLGQVKLQLKKYDAAIAAFTNIINFNHPRANHTSAFINRCHAFLALDLLLDASADCSEARDILQRASLRTPASDEAWLLPHQTISLAYVERDLFVRMGRFEMALDVLSSASNILELAIADGTLEPERKSTYWALFLSKAEILGQLDRYDEALTSLEVAADLAPETDLHQVLDARATILRRAGDLQGAQMAWLEAIARVPGGKPGQAATLNYRFKLCTSLLRAGLYAPAVEQCRGLVKAVNEDNRDHLEALFVALARAGNVSAAAELAVGNSHLREDPTVTRFLVNETINLGGNALRDAVYSVVSYSREFLPDAVKRLSPAASK